jgi:hypothetical protein
LSTLPSFAVLFFPIANTLLVKFAGLLAQLVAAVILVSEATSPKVYIPLGIMAFAFGVVEGGIAFWRA